MSDKKYVTTNDYEGMGYYDIAKVMSDSGDKMNHSTARNIVIRSFSKIVKNISQKYDKKYSDKQIKEIAKSPQFQNSIVEIMKGYKREKEKLN
tara:strand:- start:154 stop:432 length:279 start_codon:yes stop_codon:yes gene_type:complete